jgi:hypothetical protein
MQLVDLGALPEVGLKTREEADELPLPGSRAAFDLVTDPRGREIFQEQDVATGTQAGGGATESTQQVEEPEGASIQRTEDLLVSLGISRIGVHVSIQVFRNPDGKVSRELLIEENFALVHPKHFGIGQELLRSGRYLGDERPGRPGFVSIQIEYEPVNLAHETVAFADSLGLYPFDSRLVEDSGRAKRLRQPIRRDFFEISRDIELGHGPIRLAGRGKLRVRRSNR